MANKSSALWDSIEAINNNGGHAHAAGNTVGDGIEIWKDPGLNPYNLYAAAKNFIDGLGGTGQDLDTVTEGMKTWIKDKITEKINKGEYEVKPNGNYAGGIWYDDYGLATSFHAANPGYVKETSDWADIVLNTGTNGWAVGVTLGLADWEVNPTTGEVIWTGGTEYNFEKMGDWINRYFDSGDPREISKFAPTITLDTNAISAGTYWNAWINPGSSLILYITLAPRVTAPGGSWNVGPIMFDGVQDGETVPCWSNGPDGSTTGTVTSSGGTLTYDLTATINEGVVYATNINDINGFPDWTEYVASGNITGLTFDNSVSAYRNVEIRSINP